jgi:hypothetical protein
LLLEWIGGFIERLGTGSGLENSALRWRDAHVEEVKIGRTVATSKGGDSK